MNGRLLAPSEPAGLARDGSIDPSLSTRPLLRARRRMVHSRTTPDGYLVSQRHRSDSARRSYQLTITQEREADIGGVRSKEGKELATLKAFGQRLVEFQRGGANLGPMSAVSFEIQPTAQDPKSWLKAEKTIVA